MASSSSSTLPEPPRPQAGPLPSKRGEIGFRESLLVVQEETERSSQDAENLPTRHPADREPTPSDSEIQPPPPAVLSSSSEAAAQSAAALSSGSSSASLSASPSSSSMRKFSTRRWFRFPTLWNHKTVPKFGGLHLTTIFRLCVHLLVLGATIAGWILVSKHIHPEQLQPDPNSVPQGPDGGIGNNSTDTSNNGNNNGGGGNSALLAGGTASIFVHVAFGIATLAQFLYLERCIFHLRAQRYMYTHPGEVLPLHLANSTDAAGRLIYRNGGGMPSPIMPFAPWHRPPLPTYAAALAQSGYGTGDVEDNLIAIPPPPAYGNTRNSTLLLSGFLRDSLRMNRPRESDEESGRGSRRASTRSERSDRPSRPVSYRSRDEEWEERCDAQRAFMLEETLAKLEEQSPPKPRSQPPSHSHPTQPSSSTSASSTPSS